MNLSETACALALSIIATIISEAALWSARRWLRQLRASHRAHTKGIS
ncbi:hypothetical protein OG851_42950 (plasmid) [Streptomyces sp. NBC_00161]